MRKGVPQKPQSQTVERNQEFGKDEGRPQPFAPSSPEEKKEDAVPIQQSIHVAEDPDSPERTSSEKVSSEPEKV